MNPNQPSNQNAPGSTPINFMNPSATTSGNAPTLGTGLTSTPFKPPATSANQGKPATTGFNLTSSTPASGFNLTPNTQASGGFSLPISTTASGGFNLAASTQASTPPNFGIPSTSKPATGISFGTPKATTTAAAPASTSAPTTSTPSLGLTTSIPATSGTATIGTTNLTLGAKTPAPPAPSAQPPSITFQQLEELILNKWTAELYDQEKVFYNQATQINIWDKVINENAEKLTQLHGTMEKVRKQQTKINDDLEVIATHQKDLEACLIPLEKDDLLSVLKGDPNRKNLYTNAKKIDSQIKSMSENLKETIEHINETSRSHDTEDPVIQVGRILNAHMESLRWIDEHTARMQDYFDSLLKVHDDLRRECDLSKH